MSAVLEKLNLFERIYPTKKLKIYAAMCAHRDIKVRTYKVFKALEQCPYKDVSITNHILEGDASIARSRSRVATQFLNNTDADILFFIDDDIVFNVMDFLEVAKATTDHGVV